MKQNEVNMVYHCRKCGLTVEVTTPGMHPVCCGEDMELYAENTVEASLEKHIPVTESIPGGTRVTVGAVEHPSTPEHHIQWIEIINGPYVNRCNLQPGDAPKAEFYVPLSDKVTVRACCNLHGLWKK